MCTKDVLSCALNSLRTPVLRTTARTTNVTVILLGAGLTAVLTYALTSELFSKNSPTVLYNEACEKIKASPKVRGLTTRYLSGANPPDAHVCKGLQISTRILGLS